MLWLCIEVMHRHSQAQLQPRALSQWHWHWTLGDQPGMLAARAQSSWRIWNDGALMANLESNLVTFAPFAAQNPFRFHWTELTGAANSLADFRERCLAEKCRQYLLHGGRTCDGVASDCDDADDDDNDDGDSWAVLWLCLLLLLSIDSYCSISNNLCPWSSLSVLSLYHLASRTTVCSYPSFSHYSYIFHHIPTIFLLIVP